MSSLKKKIQYHLYLTSRSPQDENISHPYRKGRFANLFVTVSFFN